MTHAEILQSIGTDRAVAALVEQPLYRVRKWRQRDRIPSPHWLPVIDAARRKRIRGVTLRALAGG